MQLFGTSRARVDLLNATASSAFRIVHDELLNGVQLGLSKLADRATTGKHENATLRKLAEDLRAAGEELVADQFGQALATYDDACERLRRRRHKSIAHADLETTLARRIKPSLGPSRNEIDAALEALRMAMNVLAGHFKSTHVVYERPSVMGDGQALLNALQRSIRYRELVSQGTVARDDFWQRFKGPS